MSATTDDGFIAESRSEPRAGRDAQLVRWIILALDETEALGLLNAEIPEYEHELVASGDDVRA